MAEFEFKIVLHQINGRLEDSAEFAELLGLCLGFDRTITISMVKPRSARHFKMSVCHQMWSRSCKFIVTPPAFFC